MYSLPRLDLQGNRPVRSVYATDMSLWLMIMYATSLVLMLGDREGQKLSSSISRCKTSSKDSPGRFLFFNVWKCFRIADKFGVDDGGLVLCRFCRSWCIWPCTVAVEIERCLEISWGVRPGQDLKWCFLIAVIIVDLTGEKQAA